LQLSKGKGHKIKRYTLQKEIKREKSEFLQAAVNKIRSQSTCPCARQTDRQGLQSGREALGVGKSLCITVSKTDFI
jgi:GTP cyclohydrolase FolE2